MRNDHSQGRVPRRHETFDTLLSWLVKSNYLNETETGSFITMPYSNPLEGASSEYRCDFAFTIDCKVPENDLGIFSNVIPEGYYAVLNYVGQREIHGFIHAITKIVTEWLPKTEWEAMPAPILFEHINSPLFVPESELITKICIPVLKKHSDNNKKISIIVKLNFSKSGCSSNHSGLEVIPTNFHVVELKQNKMARCSNSPTDSPCK